MHLLEYAENCRAVAIGKYGISPKVAMAWKDEAFMKDLLEGLSPSEAIEARIREVPGEAFLQEVRG